MNSTHHAALTLLSSAVAHAAEIVIAIDPQGTITLWNNTAEAVTGVTAAQAVGRTILAYVAPAQHTTAHLLLLHPADTDRDIEFALRVGRGRYARYCWRRIGVSDTQGAIVAILLYGQKPVPPVKPDLLAEQMAQYALLGLITQGIGHDLRNPLGVALASSQLLMQQGVDPAFVQACALRIERALMRTAQHIDRFAEIVRQMNDVIEPVDIHEQLRLTIELLHYQFLERDIDLVITPPAEPAVIFRSLEQIRQLIVGLGVICLRLAARGATITIECEPGTSSMVQARLRISAVDRRALRLLDFLTAEQLPSSAPHGALTLLICWRAVTARGALLQSLRPADDPSALVVICDIRGAETSVEF